MRLTELDSSKETLAVHRRPDLSRLEKLARLLDSAFTVPGTNIQVGLDPLLGLIPGMGDGIATILSGLILLGAAKLGAPKRYLLRMLGNILLDSLISAVPLLGDIVDVGFKANMRNLDILYSIPETAWSDARDARSAGSLIVGLLLLVIVSTTAIAVYLAVLLFRALSA